MLKFQNAIFADRLTTRKDRRIFEKDNLIVDWESLFVQESAEDQRRGMNICSHHLLTSGAEKIKLRMFWMTKRDQGPLVC